MLSISYKKLYLLLFWGFTGFYLPMFFFFALLALFGIVPSNLDGSEYVGVKGFIIIMFFSVFVIFFVSIFTWIILIIGLRITTFVKNIIKKEKTS